MNIFFQLMISAVFQQIHFLSLFNHNKQSKTEEKFNKLNKIALKSLFNDKFLSDVKIYLNCILTILNII